MNAKISMTVVSDEQHSKFGIMVENAMTVDDVVQALNNLTKEQTAALAAMKDPKVIIGGKRTAKEALVSLAQEVKAALGVRFVPVRYTDYAPGVTCSGVKFR